MSDGVMRYLSETTHRPAPSGTSDLSLSLAKSGCHTGDQVWCTDITYIPINRGFLYLVAIIDWHSRKVLAWRISNTMETHFCVEALEGALALYDAPEIYNTEQGTQFTSWDFTVVLKTHGIKISIDGR